MLWDQLTTLLFSELWIDSSHWWVWRSLWCFSLIRALKSVSHQYNADNNSFSRAICYVPQLCLLPVLNYVAWLYVKWHPYLWRTYLCQTCWLSSCQEKGLCLHSPSIYIVAVGHCWTWRDAALVPHLPSGLWWFTPENPMDLPSAGQKCPYCPFCYLPLSEELLADR